MQKVSINVAVFNEEPAAESPDVPHVARIEVTIQEPRFDAFAGLKLICKITSSIDDPNYYHANVLPKITAYFEGALGDNYSRLLDYEEENTEKVMNRECEWYRTFNYDFDANKELIREQDNRATAILAEMGIDRNSPAFSLDVLDMLDLMSKLTRYAIEAHNTKISHTSDGGDYDDEILFKDVDLQLEHVPYPI